LVLCFGFDVAAARKNLVGGRDDEMADTLENGGTQPMLPLARRQRLTGRKQLKDQTRVRLLVACLVAGVVATIVFLAAMATTDWVSV